MKDMAGGFLQPNILSVDGGQGIKIGHNVIHGSGHREAALGQRRIVALSGIT
jgi:hypothetical protein